MPNDKPTDVEIVKPRPTHLDIKSADLDPTRAVQMAEARATFLEKVAKASLKRLLPHDFIDESGRPYLQCSGAERLCALWGVYFRDIRIEPDMETAFRLHQAGQPVTFICTGIAGSRVLGEESEFMGARSASDTFFANQQVLDLADVRKAAYTNFVVNAVTRLLGLRNLTWDYLRDVGFDASKAGAQVIYKADGKAAKWEAKHTDLAKAGGRMVLEMVGGDVTKAGEMLKEITAFTGKDGKEVPGKTSWKDLTPKRVEVAYGKVKRRFREWAKELGWYDDEIETFIKEG